MSMGSSGRERRLLQRVRLPEPGGGELLLAVRRAARRRARRRGEATADVLGRGGRASTSTTRTSGSKGRRSSSAPAAAGRGRASSRPASAPASAGRPDCEIFLDDVTVSRNHAVLVAARRAVRRRGPGLAERHVRQPPADRQRTARKRRRAADRQVPDDLHRMTTTARTQPQREQLLRIGEVVRRLTEEFPDISISKIRYLEDEGLLAPRRTQGGYRLFSEDDLERLETILRLQRDEFLPLRVIKDELDAPGTEGAQAPPPDSRSARTRRRSRSTSSAIEPGSRSTSRRSSRSSACSRRAGAAATSAIPRPTPTLLRHVRGSFAYGVSPRHLRTFRTAAAREASLLEQIVGACTARAQQRAARRRDCASFSSSASSSAELTTLLFWRDLRDLAAQ